MRWHGGRNDISYSKWGKSWTVGDVIGCAADSVNNKISFSFNGSWQTPMGCAFQNDEVQPKTYGSRIFPAISASSSTIRFNFGERVWRYGPPDDSFRAVQWMHAMAQAKQVSSIVINGQIVGEPCYFAMGVYELVEEECVNGRGVWAKEQEGCFLFYAQQDNPVKQWHWFISDREDMEAGRAAGWMKVASTVLLPDKITEMWIHGTGPGWEDMPRAHVCTVEEHAMAQAKQAGTIMIEGQQQDDQQHDKMGVYTLVDEECVNGRGVWTMTNAEGEECCLYYAQRQRPDDRRGHWWISMEVGEARGWMKVASTALTPDKITETWEVRLRAPFHLNASWHDAPKVKTRGQATGELPALVVGGFPSSEAKSFWFSPKSESKLNGRYLPMEGKLVNGHSVWHDEGGSNFLYFAQRKVTGDHWWISDHEDMEVGAPRGFAKVKVRFGGMPYNKHEECECWQIFEQGKWEDAQDAVVKEA
jgi:hypothetical protein